MNNDLVRFQPLHKQIRDVIYKRIVDGIYRPGVALPTEPQLAAEFKTSIAPIRQAVSGLEADGILRKRQGKGTFVAENKTTLTMVTHLSAYPAVLPIFNALLKDFERENPLIAVEHVAVSAYEARDYILSHITNGRSPDVVQLLTFWTSYFASMGALEPLDGLLAGDGSLLNAPRDDFHDGRYQDRLYSLPWGLSPFTHFANRNMLDACGIRLSASPVTIDEFTQLCGVVDAHYRDDPSMYTYSLTVTGGYSDFLTIYAYLQAFGGGFTNTKEEVIFNSKENVAAFAWLRRFVGSTKVLVSQIEPGRKAFAEGRVAFKLEGPYLKYDIEQITGQPFEKNFQVFLNPVCDQSQPSRSWNNNVALAICSQSENKLFAAKLVSFLSRDERLHGVFSRFGYLPGAKDELDAQEFQDGFYTVYRRQLEHSSVINAHHPLFEQAMDLCADSVRKILFTDTDIEKELDEKEYYLNMLYKKKKFI